MTDCSGAAHWAFGQGLWYSDPLAEVEGLSEEQLLWAPTALNLCALWHVGHIAHRERFQIGHILQGRPEAELVPEGFQVFGPGWHGADAVRYYARNSENVFAWFRQVRQASHEYLDSLKPGDFLAVPPSSKDGLCVGQVLVQAVAHTALHVGRIQLLRAIMETRNERVS